MEVYTCLYDNVLQELVAPSAIILNKNSFGNFLADNKIYFSGSGSKKFESICESENALFISADISAEAIKAISIKKFIRKQFEPVAYANPLYIKDFYSA